MCQYKSRFFIKKRLKSRNKYINSKKVKKKHGKCRALMLPFESTNYLFENCGALRALCKPYFLRSFALGSRVR